LAAILKVVTSAGGESAIPERVGDYRVFSVLGRGAMGVVYEVARPGSSARYALKTIAVDGWRAEDYAPELARFQREVEALGRLTHPAIVRVHSADLEGPVPYLVQELLPGGTLAGGLADGPLPPAEAVAVVRRIGEGLAHAHAAGVLHRDLKPENVLFGEDGGARLTDFGLARRVERASGLTRTGELVGTPAYMAPEQVVSPKDVDVRTDVYGLGAILYAALTGRPPVPGRTVYEAVDQVVNRTPEPPSAHAPGVPGWLDAACARALAKRAEDRFPDVPTFLAALEAEAARRPRRRGVAGGLALGALVAAAAPFVVASAERGAEGGPTPAGAEGGPTPAGAAALLSEVAAVASITTAPEVVARGRVGPGAPAAGVEVVLEAEASDVVASTACAPGDSFALSWPLALGDTARLALSVRRAGRRGELAREELGSVTRVPRWYADVPDPARLPLPAGVRFGAVAGEYELDLARGDVAPLVFVWVPAGPGGPGFFIGKQEVRRDQAAAVVSGLYDRDHRPIAGDSAADRLSAADALALCEVRPGLRLPNEVEWERASGLAAGRAYPWGDEPPRDHMRGVINWRLAADRLDWLSTEAALELPGGLPSPDGPARGDVSPVGCHHMAGNVSEYLFADDGTGPEAGVVFRGGNFDDVFVERLRLDYRRQVVRLDQPSGRKRRLGVGVRLCLPVGE